MTSNQELSEFIRSTEPDIYGERYNDHILEMWKTYLGMADQISNRRERANAFFLTIHTAAFAAIGFLIENNLYPWVAAICILVGIPMAYLWYRLVRSYKDLNSAKFKVVHEIEKLLPLRPFDAEWEAVGRGNDSSLYLPFTHVEIRVPIMLLGAYGLLAGLFLWLNCAQG